MKLGFDIFRRVFLAAFLMGGLLAVPQQALAGQMSSTLDVVVVTRLSLVHVDDLQFGNIIPSASAGTVTISPLGVRTSTGGVTLAGGTVQAASFAGLGARNQRVRISLGSTSYTLTRVSGTQTMVLNNMVIGNPPGSGLQQTGPRYRITDTTGLFTFAVGGRLNVGANQTGGTYVGTFDVNIIYE